MVDWTVPAEFVVTYDIVTDCRAGMSASHRMPQYEVDEPKEQEIEGCAFVVVTYSAALEAPVPAIFHMSVAEGAPMEPAFSITEV